MTRPKLDSTRSPHAGACARSIGDADASFGSPLHDLHENHDKRGNASANIHATPAARILYFIVLPALLWAMIIQTARIL